MATQQGPAMKKLIIRIIKERARTSALGSSILSHRKTLSKIETISLLTVEWRTRDEYKKAPFKEN